MKEEKKEDTPPEIFDSVEGTGFTKGSSPGSALLLLRLVIEPETPFSFELMRLLLRYFRRRKGFFVHILGRHILRNL